MAALTDAESDYIAALALLEKDTDEQDADAVLTLKKDVLVKHAAVCMTLVLFAKAAADYDALEKLGEDVSGKRSELDDLIDAEDPDAENGIPADDAENGGAAEPEETPAASEEEKPADSKPEKPASSTETPASRKEQPAESKEEPSASSQPAAQKETYHVQSPVWSEVSATVTYQVGTNTIYTKCVEVFDGIQTVIENTYTLSQPLTSAEHPSKGSTVFHVPAGTTVTCQYKYNGPDGSEQGNGIIWGKVSSVGVVKYDGEFTNIDLNYTGSLTVQGGFVYAIADENEGGGFVDFPAVGFIGD